MEAFTPKHLEPWVEQINYEGQNFDDYYVAAWRFFRCTPAERANFKFVKARLQEHNLPAWAVICPAFTDEVCLVRYYILIHKDCQKALRLSDVWAARTKLGEILDPTMAETLDRKGVHKHWKMSNVSTRVRYCQEHQLSIFAARRNELPDSQSLFEQLSEAA